ncbi:MAG: hypothetical protein JWN38_1087 [Candidatus Saccharibacteria bacterium]|nr:hypothetical protein [Candidatus Saccharibacteria bacterium]
MPRKILAIANCRVSTDEQLSNNSLNRQGQSVANAAIKLEAEIVRTWSGSVSSKAGTNVTRKDMTEMIEFCKHNKDVKYAIFDEYDRYMRSINEGAYFEVLFQQQGVKVWYASESDAFNGNDAMAKFMRSMSAYKAEGSNEERQRKSIAGQTVALKEGRWPFVPKPGYKRGVESAMPLVHQERGPALQRVLKRLAAGLITPPAALKELNESEFTQNHSVYKMDEKFINIVTDPFYAGILDVNKQVKVRNENGLHEPLISREEHLRLVEIMAKKPKYQTGPRKNGNPEFPMSNILIDDKCLNSKHGGRSAGFNHTNGKNPDRVYKKYRCRTCNRYWHKDYVDEHVIELFERYEMTDDVKRDILDALDVVWQQNENKAVEDIKRLRESIASLRTSITQKVDSATDPSNAEIKQEIFNIITEKRAQLSKFETQLAMLNKGRDDDQREFMEFAIGFVQDTGKHFLQEYVSRENRLRCKQMIFPAGILINQKNKIYTPEMSVFYRLAAKKKDAEASIKSLMVRVRGL